MVRGIWELLLLLSLQNNMLIDTHCHLSFKAFENDWKDVVKRARERDILMITVGAARETSQKSIAIAQQEDGVFASIGCHPTHADDEEFDADWYSSAADNPKVVAIGETGIDYYHLNDRDFCHSDRAVLGERRNPFAAKNTILKKQEELLINHLKIAKEKDLPVILHARSGKTESSGIAYEHLYRVIKDFGYFRCVVHCFGGSWDWAEKFLDLGLMISFTGIVTFKNASEALKEVVRKMPLDRFMIETDAPYLSPEPMRGKQNEPAFVEYVARGIADIRNLPYDEIAMHTTENARRFFGI